MAIISETVKIKPRGKAIKYYEDLGYYIPRISTTYRKSILKVDPDFILEVKISDLPEHSVTRIEAECDFCKAHTTPTYNTYTNSIKNNNLNLYACKNCIPKKLKIINQMKYGVDSTSQLESSKEKMKQTNLLKYGVKSVLQVPEIKEKRFNTCIERYGHKHLLQCPEFAQKRAETLYRNNNQKTSMPQKYISNLYNGILNFPCGKYNLDSLVDDKYDIEYDGSGHFLAIQEGYMTEKDFNIYTIIRDKYVKSQGYKVIRIISSSDRIPQDCILNDMLNYIKEFFNLHPNCNWLEFHIDDSSVYSFLFPEGIFYDYGLLRKITKKDIKEELVC